MEKTFNHTGIDLFFKNANKKRIKILCGILNDLDREMNGHKLVWRVTNNSTITCRYPKVSFTMAEMLQGLNLNRVWGESLARVYNEERKTNLVYNGSEFYVLSTIDELEKETQRLVREA